MTVSEGEASMRCVHTREGSESRRMCGPRSHTEMSKQAVAREVAAEAEAWAHEAVAKAQEMEARA